MFTPDIKPEYIKHVSPYHSLDMEALKRLKVKAKPHKIKKHDASVYTKKERYKHLMSLKKSGL